MSRPKTRRNGIFPTAGRRFSCWPWRACAGTDNAEADRIATKIPLHSPGNFPQDRTIREKYNDVTRSSETHIVEGYAQNVIGFGWTNAVFLELLHDRRMPFPVEQRTKTNIGWGSIAMWIGFPPSFAALKKGRRNEHGSGFHNIATSPNLPIVVLSISLLCLPR